MKRGLVFLVLFLILVSSAYAFWPFVGYAVADSSCSFDLIVSGNKYNIINFYLEENGVIINEAFIERQPGNPAEQAVSLDFDVSSDKSYTLLINADCTDQNGANPVFIKVNGKKDKVATINCNKNNPFVNEIADVTLNMMSCAGCIPSQEKCDSIDNDCDGLIDEDLVVQCGETDIGTCAFGERKCINGAWSTCSGAVEPDEEECNGLDDDCDGLIDENIVKDCSTHVGECSLGEQVCANGEWGMCSGIGPTEEICDSLDNDCDGKVDEGCECENGEVRQCGTNVGECTYGAQVCSNGKWGECDGEMIKPVDEVCDGLDNDCDGLIDEDLVVQCGETDIGICSFGEQRCANAEWGVCEGAVNPGIELCNGLDDDCDGSVDESLFEQTGSGLKQCIDGEWIGSLVKITNNLDSNVVFNLISDDSAHGNGLEYLDEIDVGSLEIWEGYLIVLEQDESGYPKYYLDAEGYELELILDNELVINLIEGENVIIDGNHIILNKELVYQPVRPILECVAESGDGYTAYFGYKNENPFSVEIPVGESNKFTPSPQDRGQPVIFEEGRTSYYPNAEFSIDFDGSNLVWTLEGPDGARRTSTASSNPAQRCPEECTDIDKDGFSSDGEKCGLIDCDDNNAAIYPGAEEICDNLDNNCDNFIDEEVQRNCGCDCGDAKILMVLDDYHHNEDLDDFEKTYENLRTLGMDVTKMNEPQNGLTWDMAKNYELLWFSNPGWPMDDINSLNVIKQFYGDGRPVVIQGDDMTWSEGFDKKELEEFIGLRNQNNGLDTNYTVTFENKEHPLLTHLAGKSMDYINDDIDTSVATGDLDIDVLATAKVINNPSYNGPAIIVRDESESGDGILVLTLLTLSKISPESDALTFTANIVNWVLSETEHCECGPDNGICKKGIQECTNGEWSDCVGDNDPEVEICDNIDNDCDGTVDEDLIRECGNDIGECTSGTQTCHSGEWGACEGTGGFSEEICDGLDNDCDGTVDEETSLVCGTNVGICTFGMNYCINGNLLGCDGVMPEEEICDRLDNNCDGNIDEGCECVNGEIQQCGIGKGICEFGSQICSDGVWGECDAKQPSYELCDGLDNDCDGYVDEGLTKRCGTDIGECSFGISRCSEGEWLECAEGIFPSEEKCDGLDNDCNGYVDEVCGGGSAGGASSIKFETKAVSEGIKKQELIKKKPAVDDRCKDVKPIIGEIYYPGKVDITDSKFNIVVTLLNPTDCEITDFNLGIDVEEGWKAEGAVVDIGPYEKKSVVFNIYSSLCSFDGREKELYDEMIDVSLIFLGEKEKLSIPMNIPIISTIINKETIKENILETCFIINKKRENNLEIEFALSDRKEDVIIDYLTPIKTKDKVLIKKIDYPIKITRQKDYTLRSFLFSGGKVFKGTYLIAEYTSKEDLSEAEPVTDWFGVLVTKIRKVFE